MTSTWGGCQSENRLGESIEFGLVYDLCRHCCDRLVPAQYREATGTSRRRNAARTLYFELRRVLVRSSDLRLILDLDPTDDEEDIDEGQELLREFCDLLDDLSHHHFHELKLDHYKQQGQGSKYAQLTALWRHLKGSAAGSQPQFEVISRPGHDLHPALFILPSQAETVKAIKVVKRFNGFIDQLKLSKAELDDLTGAPLMGRTPSWKAIEQSPSKRKTELPPHEDPRPVSKRFGDRFKHAKAAIEAMFLRLSKCSHRGRMAHHILVQLPAVEEITSQDNCNPSISLGLFLSDCPDSSQWQEARVIRVRDRRTPAEPSICNAIKEALGLAGGLHFHIQEELTGTPEIDFLIPFYNYVAPEHDQAKPSKSLWNLLDANLLSRVPLATHYLSADEVHLVGENERRSLAIQLLFGLVTCLRYGCTTATWDPKRVFVLLAEDGGQNPNMFPYVSCVEGDAKAAWFDLPDPDVVFERSPTPSPAFTKMAKLLLEIGFGECLDRLEVDTNGNNQQLWNQVWDIVHKMKPRKEKRREEDGLKRPTTWIRDPEVFPYIAAADCCLRFSFLYRTEVSRLKRGLGVKEIDTWAIVENIIYDQIICEFEQRNFTASAVDSMESVLDARSRAKRSSGGGERPKGHRRVDANPTRQNVVTLFDNSSNIPRDSMLVSRAEGFLRDLEAFRTSYKSFVNEGNGTPSQRPVRIAILDTGIDKSNVEIYFDGKHMKDDWCINFVGDPRDFHDDDGHGTHCASLLRNVAPDAEIYVAKVFSHNEFDLTQAGNISKAIDHVVKEWDVDIISMSFGLQPPSSQADMPEWRKMKSEIEEKIALASPRLLFAAAANEGKNKPRAFPSTDPTVFCVHASDGKGNDGGINPHHDSADNNFMTLGIGIQFLEEDDFVYKEGTSFATAIAAGMAASILDLTSRTSQLQARSKAGLRTARGMRELFRKISGSDWGQPRPYVAPWNYWRQEYWTTNQRGLDMIWAELDVLLNSFPESCDARRLYGTVG